ncbi:MAG: serine/threonine-protein kinase [Candidatus Micrarchaeota archaeon]
MQGRRGSESGREGSAPPSQSTRVESPGNAFRKKSPKTDEQDMLVGALMSGMFGKYSIQEWIGGGGMGTVYKAMDVKHNRIVAVKVIKQKSDMSAEERDRIIGRFYREARSAREIDHPNVVKMFDVGTYRDKVFCVMEHLEGMNLKDALVKSGKLQWSEIARLMVQICDGVQAAHDVEIIHRDLKPENIFLTRVRGAEVVKVLDFGLAKSVTGDQSYTESDNVPGTLAYVAPEQIRKAQGEIEDIDTRADIYALGVMMYRMITGEVPNKGDSSMEALMIRVKVVPRRPSEIDPSVPEEVDSLIMRALEIEPDDRFQTCEELGDAITATLPREEPSAPREEGSLLARMGDAEMVEESSSGMNGRSYVPLVRKNEAGERSKRGGAAGRIAKWAVITAITAGAAYGGYAYRDAALSMLRGSGETSSSGAQPTASAPEREAPRQEFWMTVESSPPRAAVYMMNGQRRGERLGETPLQRRMPSGEFRVMVSRGGFEPQVRRVSDAEPTIRVRLQRRAQGIQHQPEEPEAAEEGSESAGDVPRNE